MLQQKPLFIALDFPDGDQAMTFLEKHQLIGVPVKVGMELFYKEGPSLIEKLKDRQHPIFLDLKLHDIPTTVHNAMRNIASLGVDVVNVHAAGGVAMMKAAQEGLMKGSTSNESKPLLLAVTQLTSTSEEVLKQELLISHSMNETIAHYANQAKEAGVDGVVCSVREAKMIHQQCGESFYTVTPGIRLEDTNHHDQVRVASPIEAKEQGVDAIVIGRSITKASDPKEVYDKALKEWGYVNETSFS